MSSPLPRLSSLSLTLVLLVAATDLRAKDAYGNSTAWTNSDNTIRDIQSERARAERPQQWWQTISSGPAPAPYWEQEALRRRQAAEAVRERERDEAWERHQRVVALTPPKPVSYREYLESRVRQHSDRAAQEELAFYLVSIGEPVAALYHLEMVAFLKRSPRAGEAAWQLFRIASPGGAQPDAARAARYLQEAVALKNADAMFTRAHAWIFGDKKLGLAPDPARGRALMESVLHSDSYWYRREAGEILFKQYALGVNGPADPAKAIAVTRHMRTFANNGAVENWQEDMMVDLLIASPGGWAEHHEEIVAAIGGNFSSILNPDKAERLVRIHLGLDPEVRAHVPINPRKGAETLRDLAGQDPDRAKAYLPVILLPGPAHHGEGAYKVLDILRERQPREVTWIRTTAELLANAYGDFFAPESLTRYLDSWEKAETPVQLLAASQFFAVGGKNVPAQPARAERLLQRAVSGLQAQHAASRADSMATYELARLHVLGLGVPRDIPAAVALLKSHGSSDEPPAILYPHRVLLASIYQAGYGVAKAPRQARHLLAYPARQGYAPAQAALAELARTWPGDEPLDDSDREEAFRYAKAAAATGDTNARLTLAHFYQDGFGTEADPELALTIYQDGANSAVPGALVGLAILRLDESGPWHDASAGFAAAQRAADLGDPEGAYLLGQCWEDGRGTPPDNARALALYEQAARAGHWPSAVIAARLLTVNAPPLKPDPVRALAVLESTALNATNDQQLHLVQLFLGEAFLPENKDKARHWAKLAAANGSEDAEWLFRPGQPFGDQ